MSVRRSIQKSLKFGGLSARPEVVRALEQLVKGEEDVQGYLNEVLRLLKSKLKSSSVVDVEILKEVVAELEDGMDDDDSTRLDIVDAFKMPRYTYNISRKRFILDSTQGNLQPRQYTIVFRERINVVRQRFDRYRKKNSVELLSLSNTAPLSTNRRRVSADNLELTSLEALITASGDETLAVLGMLHRMEDGNLYLEDINGRVRIDAIKAVVNIGLVTEGCIVVALGKIVDDIFVADAIGFPTAEPRKQTMLMHGNLDSLQGGRTISKDTRDTLLRIERREVEASFLILSDVHLDDVGVQNQLKTLLQAFSEMDPIPCLIVLMGSFSKKPFGEGEGQCSAKEYAKLMAWLGELLLACPQILQHSKVVLIPGPEDPGSYGLLPRPGIPRFFSKHLTSVLEESKLAQEHPEMLGKVCFSSNPCRVEYFTQELVFFRDNLISKLHRNCIKPPSQDHPIPKHYCHTIVNQGHLCSLPLHVRPLSWAHDHALRLYPLPHIVFSGDRYDQFSYTHQGCKVANPGAFNLDYSFVLYRPSDKTVEFSKVNPMEENEYDSDSL